MKSKKLKDTTYTYEYYVDNRGNKKIKLKIDKKAFVDSYEKAMDCLSKIKVGDLFHSN